MTNFGAELSTIHFSDWEAEAQSQMRKSLIFVVHCLRVTCPQPPSNRNDYYRPKNRMLVFHQCFFLFEKESGETKPQNLNLSDAITWRFMALLFCPAFKGVRYWSVSLPLPLSLFCLFSLLSLLIPTPQPRRLTRESRTCQALPIYGKLHIFPTQTYLSFNNQ